MERLVEDGIKASYREALLAELSGFRLRIQGKVGRGMVWTLR